MRKITDVVQRDGEGKEEEYRCGDGGGSVNVAGEDESVGTLGIGCCEYDERRGEGMKAMMMMIIMSVR